MLWEICLKIFPKTCHWYQTCKVCKKNPTCSQIWEPGESFIPSFCRVAWVCWLVYPTMWCVLWYFSVLWCAVCYFDMVHYLCLVQLCFQALFCEFRSVHSISSGNCVWYCAKVFYNTMPYIWVLSYCCISRFLWNILFKVCSSRCPVLSKIVVKVCTSHFF